MFGGDHNQLSMVVELCKDLFATTERPYIERTPKVIGGGGSYDYRSHGKFVGRGGPGAGKEHKNEKVDESGAGRGMDSPRGGKAPRGGKD